MSKKIAIVTGSNKGLGFEIVKGLSKEYEGEVYLTSRDEVRGKQACEELRKLGLEPKYHQLDVTNEESVETFCSYIKKTYGQVDLIVNNAGILFLKDAPEPKVYQAEETLKVNYFSLVKFTEAMLALVKNGGNILNISSSSGHLSRIPSEKLKKELQSPDLSVDLLNALMEDYLKAVRENRETEEWGESPYVVSKCGLNAYTFILHRRLQSRGITVNSVHPGYVMTDMTRGAGTESAAQAAVVPLQLVLRPPAGGLYVWNNGSPVPWDGEDPRVFIDGKKF